MVKRDTKTKESFDSELKDPFSMEKRSKLKNNNLP